MDSNINIEIDLNALRNSGGLFVGMPCFGGNMTGITARCMMDLAALCAQHGIKFQSYFMFNESLIGRARAYIADEFLRSECDTFLFIDADIGFNALDVLVMWHLQLTKTDFDIVAAPYPKKCISWEKIKKAVDKGFADNNPEELANFVGDYVFSPLKSGTIKLNEPVEVLESGTGYMMIKRSTFEKWRETFPQFSYKPDHARTANFDGSREIHMFFHCDIDPETKQYLSEDYFFCRKTREAGMKVWLLPWIKTTHTGTYTFEGSLPHLAAINADIAVDKNK